MITLTVYSSNPQAERSNPLSNNSSTSSSDPYTWAWGITDQISLLNDRLILVGGARYDNVREINDNLITGTTVKVAASNWSYRYGAVFKPTTNASIFANHSETFEAQPGAFDSFGTKSPSTIDGVSDEIGIKLNLFEGQLVLTGSYFDMTLSPFFTSEFVLGTQDRRLVDRGSNITRGHEIDLTWQPNNSLTLLVGYGNLTSRNPEGNRFRHVPEGPNYKLFGKYRIASGRLEGLAVGGGYQFTPDRAGDGGDNFSLPEYYTMDAFVSYNRGAWTFRVNATNLTDRYLPVTSINRDRITTIDPRGVRASVGYVF